MAKKTIAPTAVDGDQNELTRDRLPSGYLEEEVTNGLTQFPAKVCLEAFSESEEFESVKVNNFSINALPVASTAQDVLRPEESPTTGGSTGVQQLLGQQLMMIGISMKDASQEQILTALQKSKDQLMLMRRRLGLQSASAQSSLVDREKVAGVSLSSEQRFGQSFRQEQMPKFMPFADRVTAENQPAQPPSSLLNLSNPDVILEVPFVNCPRKASLTTKSKEGSPFKPLFRTMGSQPVGPRFFVTDLSFPNASEVISPESQFSLEFNRRPETHASDFHQSQNSVPPKYPTDFPNSHVSREACERLTAFLRNEVELRRNPELMKVIGMFQRFV